MKQYQLCSATQNVTRQIQKLKLCISSHLSQGDPALKKIAQNHIDLLGKVSSYQHSALCILYLRILFQKVQTSHAFL